MVGIMGCALLVLVLVVVLTGSVGWEGHRVLDFELPNRGQPGGPGQPGELRIIVGVAEDASGAQRPEYRVGGQVVGGLAELRVALIYHACQPGGMGVPVVIEASDDARHGWVIAVIDCLRELRFGNVRFKDSGQDSPAPELRGPQGGAPDDAD
jgi:hypothetical protein